MPSDARDFVPVSDQATANAGFARTTHDYVPVSDQATVSVLMAIPGARVVAVTNGPSVAVTRSDDRAPSVDVGLAKNQWDMATIGLGFGVGLGVGHLPGAVVGGAVFWAWGQWRWRDTHR